MGRPADMTPPGLARSVFETFDPSDVATLIAEYPSAWVFSTASEDIGPRLLPLTASYDRRGRLIALSGRIDRDDPLQRALSADGDALILFKGPEAFIAPRHAGGADRSPGWMSAQLKIHADIWFEPLFGQEASGGEVLAVTLQAEVRRIEGLFKLGQDERPEALRAIFAAMPDPAVRRWMRRFNSARL